jgi:hypothetical protein
MNDQGVRMQLMIGPMVPVPIPAALVAAVESAEVTHRLGERSGFQITLRAPYADLLGPLFTVFNRLILVAVFGAQARVLIDGFITNQSHQPGDEPGSATLTLTGEDLSLVMDREQRPDQHPGQADAVIAVKLILRYAMYGLLPAVVPPAFSLSPSPTGRTPTQTDSDLKHLRELARRHAFVFQIIPGPAVLTNTAYWGPPVRLPTPQPAISTNLGAFTNVDSINFQHDSLATRTVSGPVQDADTGMIQTVFAAQSNRPPLASLPDWLTHDLLVRHEHITYHGPSAAEAQERAKATFLNSQDTALTATGELDTPRYGHILEVGRLVGVRGAGILYDGLYLVRAVTHSLRRGSYKQRFTLGREGLGTTTSVVRP